MEKEIEQIVVNEMLALNRPDLYRSPLVAFSSADDERYSELKEIIGEWHLNPEELLPGAKSVISYFVPFTENVVAGPKTVKDGSLLWGEAYAVINAYFEHINETVSQYLIGLGFSAKPIQATHTYSPEKLKSMWSHRSAAVIAGLGDFGINRLLITEKGSGGRLCTVITSAPLKQESKSAANRCLYIKNGSCGKCFKACPVSALAIGKFDKFSCHEVLINNRKKQMELTNYSADSCGKCISVCPAAYIK